MINQVIFVITSRNPAKKEFNSIVLLSVDPETEGISKMGQIPLWRVWPCAFVYFLLLVLNLNFSLLREVVDL